MEPVNTTSKRRGLWRRLRAWNEFATIPAGIALFIFAPTLLRSVDSTAATFDVGVLHAPLYALAAFFLLKGVAWLSVKWDFPKLYKYLDDHMEVEVFSKERQPWLKVACTFAIFLFYFASLLGLTVALL